jgi:hypothetical protein
VITAEDIMAPVRLKVLGAPGQPEQSQRSSFSRGSSDGRASLEKSDHEPCATVLLYRLQDGRLLARRVACKTKACPSCGRKLRAKAAATWTGVVGDTAVWRIVVADAEWPKLQRRLKRSGAEYGVIPGADGSRIVYTTAELGDAAGDVAEQLVADFAAMPSDRRNKTLSARWRALAKEHEEAAEQVKGALVASFLGILRKSLEHVAMVAQDLGMLLDQAGPDALFLRDPPERTTWQRFCALAGLYQRGFREQEARAA